MRHRLVVLWLLAVVVAGTGFARSEEIVQVRMSPWPGTATASASTQISFRGAGPAGIGDVAVAGLLTGAHSGRLLPHSDGQGASFLPDEPFLPGEAVFVTTDATITGTDGEAARFDVAVPAPRNDTPGSTVTEDTTGSTTYRSMPGLYAPTLTVDTPAQDTSSGVLMLTQGQGPSGSGPWIADHEGNLVWFKPLPSGVGARNLDSFAYDGRQVLAWWEGVTSVGMGFGEFVVADDSYQELFRVAAGNGYLADFHDFELTEDRTAWLIIYNTIVWNRLPSGSAGGAVVTEGVIQQIDVPTGLVLFEWHSLDHVDLAESVDPATLMVPLGADYIHINSTHVLPGGNVLISARHTSAVYEIDTSTGEIAWRLGGTRSDFAVEPDARFSYQHDAQMLGDDLLSLFDNGPGLLPDPTRERAFSRGLHIRLDRDAGTATMVRELPEPEGARSTSQGNMQPLPGGSSLIGWGNRPALSQFDSDGTLIFDARLSPGNSYRAFRHPWTGEPSQPPAFVVDRSGEDVTAYVSWNGDTRAVRWQLLAGASPEALQPVADASRDGFETAIVAQTPAGYFTVRAFDADGAVLVTAPAQSA